MICEKWSDCTRYKSFGLQSVTGNFFSKLSSSVIRQKGESQNGCFKKAKHAKISEKQTFLTSWYAHVRITCAYQGIRNVCFSEILACLAFLKHPFWDSPFCLITDELFITSGALWLQTWLMWKSRSKDFSRITDLRIPKASQWNNRSRVK